jgi:hypothetical protein
MDHKTGRKPVGVGYWIIISVILNETISIINNFEYMFVNINKYS